MADVCADDSALARARIVEGYRELKTLSDLPVERLRTNWYQAIWREGGEAYRPSVMEILEFLEAFHCRFDTYYGSVISDIRIYPDELGTRSGFHYLHGFTNHPIGRSIFVRPLSIQCWACFRELDLTVTPMQMHLAHWMASSRGGRFEIGNVYPLCVHCNLRSGSMHIHEWRELEKVKEYQKINLNDYWERRTHIRCSPTRLDSRRLQ